MPSHSAPSYGWHRQGNTREWESPVAPVARGWFSRPVRQNTNTCSDVNRRLSVWMLHLAQWTFQRRHTDLTALVTWCCWHHHMTTLVRLQLTCLLNVGYRLSIYNLHLTTMVIIVYVKSFYIYVRLNSIEYRAHWLRGTASGSQLRRPRLESYAAVLKPWASFFTLHCSSSLSCINEYLATDSGGYVYEQATRINCSIWLDASQRNWDGVWLNGSAREVKCKVLWMVLRTGYCAI